MTDSAETSPAPEKVDPDSVELRVKPRPVTCINRRVVIGGVALGVTAIAGLVVLALRPIVWTAQAPSERNGMRPSFLSRRFKLYDFDRLKGLLTPRMSALCRSSHRRFLPLMLILLSALCRGLCFARPQGPSFQHLFCAGTFVPDIDLFAEPAHANSRWRAE